MIDKPPTLPHDLADTIARNLALIDGNQPAGDVRLVGPLQHHRGLASTFLRRADALSPVGWRGPVLRGDAAIATVSIGNGEEVGISVRGADAGKRFAAALTVALDAVKDEPRARLRIMTLDDLFVRAVWLKLPRRSLWVPMRLGSDIREPEVISTRAFKAQVRKQLSAVAMTPATARRTAAMTHQSDLPPGGHCGNVRYRKKLMPLAAFLTLDDERRRKA